MGNLTTSLVLAALLISLLILPGCTYSMRLRSPNGETLHGRYRFARENTGLMEVTRSNGEILSGKFAQVGRTTFVETYEKTFGSGSISVAGLDASPYGYLSGGPFASSYGLTGSAYRDRSLDKPTNSGNVLKGPLFYWTASLQGDRGTTMTCHFVGSSYTNHGFGSCKGHAGETYSADF